MVFLNNKNAYFIGSYVESLKNHFNDFQLDSWKCSSDENYNKEIKAESFRNWEGISQKMLTPITHLDDCNLNHYNLQLSIYMYIILKHNPTFKPGKLVLHHIQFEEEDQKDEHGYPVMKKSPNGDFIIKNIIPYEMPYLKSEVMSVLMWYKDNQNKLLKVKK
jgi:hypothetical protein